MIIELIDQLKLTNIIFIINTLPTTKTSYNVNEHTCLYLYTIFSIYCTTKAAWGSSGSVNVVFSPHHIVLSAGLFSVGPAMEKKL